MRRQGSCKKPPWSCAVAKTDEMLEADSLDTSHLFSNELRVISKAQTEISPEEVTDDDLTEIMPTVDQITLTLQKIAKRKERVQMKRMTI